MTSRMTAFTAQAVVNAFNEAYPPGSPVALVLDLGKTVETVTAGPAFIAGENLMVSLVEYGQYKLDRVIPLPAHEGLLTVIPMPTEGNVQPEQHQELLTRDGRKVGNAFVTSVQGDDIEIVTDSGNKLCLSSAEAHSLFYVGEIQDMESAVSYRSAAENTPRVLLIVHDEHLIISADDDR